MKAIYEEMKMEVIRMDAQDIIVTSDGTTDGFYGDDHEFTEE